jgi:hypothetical protein
MWLPARTGRGITGKEFFFMKSTFRHFGAMHSISILALVAVIVFSMAACGDRGEGDNGLLGPTLTLTGRVFEVEERNGNKYLVPFSSGEKTVTAGGASGTISSGGQLNLTIATPTPLIAANGLFKYFEDGDYVMAPTVPAGNVCFFLDSLKVTDPSDFVVHRARSDYNEKSGNNGKNASFTLNSQRVIYVFNNTVNAFDLKGTGTEYTDVYDSVINGTTYKYTVSIKRINFTVTLEPGWNAVNIKEIMRGTVYLSGKRVSATLTTAVTRSNPSLYWIYNKPKPVQP